MEEFRGQLPLAYMLMLLDECAMKVQIKGSCAEFKATHIVITSPLHPKEWYSIERNSHDKIDQLLRRITSIVCMDTLYGPGHPEWVEGEPQAEPNPLFEAEPEPANATNATVHDVLQNDAAANFPRMKHDDQMPDQVPAAVVDEMWRILTPCT